MTAERIRRDRRGRLDEYKLLKFVRSNQGTCINQRPIVNVGDRVGDGQPLADSSPTCFGIWRSAGTSSSFMILGGR